MLRPTHPRSRFAENTKAIPAHLPWGAAVRGVGSVPWGGGVWVEV